MYRKLFAKLRKQISRIAISNFWGLWICKDSYKEKWVISALMMSKWSKSLKEKLLRESHLRKKIVQWSLVLCQQSIAMLLNFYIKILLGKLRVILWHKLWSSISFRWMRIWKLGWCVQLKNSIGNWCLYGFFANKIPHKISHSKAISKTFKQPSFLNLGKASSIFQPNISSKKWQLFGNR